MICLGRETTTEYPNLLRKRDPTPLGGNVVSQGKMIAYYPTGLERKLDEDKTFW